MNIKVTNMRANNESIYPALEIDLELTYKNQFDLPILVTGFLKVDDKIISDFVEYSEREDTINFLVRRLTPIGYNELEDFRTFFKLIILLNEKSINFIERIREKHHEKSAVFYFDFQIKCFQTRHDETSNELSLKIIKVSDSYIIKQSDWVNKYSEKLGIGKFILAELYIPNEKKIDSFWIELYARLQLNLKEMEIAIRNGDWQKVMWFSRQYFENINLNTNKTYNKEFDERLGQLFLNDNHNEDGINHFRQGIKEFFHFASKYIHDKDQKGNLNDKPIPKQEDAYFVYSLGLGLLSIIGRKLRVEE